MEKLTIFTRKTNLTPTERACADIVEKTIKMVNDGLLTGTEGSMKIWGARDVLMAEDLGSPFWLEMMRIENELIKL